MYFLDHCPICNSKKLTLLAKNIYNCPDNIEDCLKDPTSFSYASMRLSIFFSSIITNTKSFEFQVGLCKQCGFIFTNPRPTEAEKAMYYQKLSELAIPEKRQKASPPQNTDQRSERIYNLIMPFVTKKDNLKILDFGGMQGFNLKAFVNSNNTCHLLDYIQLPTLDGVTYIGSSLPENPTEKYDIIIIAHVLEHLMEPIAVLSTILKHLEKNGVLYIEVPLGSKKEWHNIDEPTTHINFFSEESMYNCVKYIGLDIALLNSEKQWVTHHELDCINAVCVNRPFQAKIKPVSFKKQIEEKNGIKHKIKWLAKSPVKNCLKIIKKQL